LFEQEYAMTVEESLTNPAAKEFYDREYSGDQYSPFERVEQHPLHNSLKSFLDTHDLLDRKVLEVGCGRGVFQDLVENYTGIDYSSTVGKYLHKTFVQGSATALPFEDESFDAAWTNWVFEHVPDPEKAFFEIRRVIKPGGVLYLAPAWFCRTWAADGYPVRPFSDFGLKGKLIKASILLRDSVLWRSMFVLPRRLARVVERLVNKKPSRLRYKKLNANFETFWMSDSDAVNSIDPFEAVMWFTSRGDTCLNYSSRFRRFLVRGGPILIRKAES
jgi:SAM-dependent methyltransferase